MIGTTVSHYRVVASAGAGGMGVVYLAEDDRLNRKAALKFLPPAVAQDPHARARLLREAQAASALDHPNVAAVYDIDESNGRLFIAMPYYDGERFASGSSADRSMSTKRRPPSMRPFSTPHGARSKRHRARDQRAKMWAKADRS